MPGDSENSTNNLIEFLRPLLETDPPVGQDPSVSPINADNGRHCALDGVCWIPVARKHGSKELHRRHDPPNPSESFLEIGFWNNDWR